MNTDNRATDELINNWQQVNAEVAEACKQSRRHIDDVKLLAVSKTKPVERIKALAQRGQRDFAGKNHSTASRGGGRRYRLALHWQYSA